VPQPTDNGLTYTFKLKPNLKFPPVNRAITSKDIAYAFQRINAAPLVAQYGFYYFGIIKGIDGQAKTAATKISGIDTPDDRTITFRLTNPAGDFLNRLAMPATGPSPRRSRSATPRPGTTAAT
jgi:peptide/nickel transport system substrate-binding protein